MAPRATSSSDKLNHFLALTARPVLGLIGDFAGFSAFDLRVYFQATQRGMAASSGGMPASSTPGAFGRFGGFWSLPTLTNESMRDNVSMLLLLLLNLYGFTEAEMGCD